MEEVSPADVAMVVAIGALLLAIAFGNLVQTALDHITRTRAQALATAEQRGARALVDLFRGSEDFRTPIAVLTLTCTLVETTLVGVVANRLFGPVSLVVAAVLNLVVVFVLATAAPRTYALVRPTRIATPVARPVRALIRRRLVRAGVRLVTRLTNLAVPGEGLEAGPFARPAANADTDEALRSGVMAHNQRELIESIAEFADSVAREIMSPRPDMVTVSADFQIADVVEVSLLNGYSRLPVCGQGIDDVIGLVYAKDLMRAERDGRAHRPVAELVRPASFVPETKRLPELLREMQHEQLHMAIVVDEYGGTAGLVTLEDIIEQLVGDIVDEFDVEDTLIEPLPGGDLLVRGRTPINELNYQLDTDLPEGEWDTVGGLVNGLLGHLPVQGESVAVSHWQLTAERIQGRRIGWVRISRSPTETMPPDEGRGNDQPRDGTHTMNGNDSGFVGGAEVLPFGLLVFVVGTLLLANVWAVVDAKFAVDAAAREATRSYVEANVVESSQGSTAEGAAVRAGLDALEAHGRDPTRTDLRLTELASPSGTPRAASGFVRCARVTFTASYQVPALTLPWIGGFGRSFDVRSQHSEVIDPYRDGVPGEAEVCG